MCGICGIINVNKQNVIDNLYESIFHLQHRGQDSCGISTSDNKRLHAIKGQGLIRYIFKQETLEKLKGYIGIGHVRYPTTGNITDNEINYYFLMSIKLKILLFIEIIIIKINKLTYKKNIYFIH